MRRRMLIIFAACAVLAAAALGCNSTADGNANTAAVTNANTARAGASNANDARPLNANVSREEFERDKDYYEREARRLGHKVGSGAEDLWLWWKTRSALAAAEDIRDLTINVDVDNNVVALTGTVGSEAQKSRAEQVARGIEGVRDVKNGLAVGRL